MENLAIHIEYLLLRHDCVVMPGFGAFINVYKAPEIDFVNNIILPMRREIRFNSALRSDDGILSNSYARKHRVSYPEGALMASKSISSMISHLKEEKEVTFGQLGIIRIGDEGNIIFETFRHRFASSEAIGLRPVSMTGNTGSGEQALRENSEQSDNLYGISAFGVMADISGKELEKFRKMNFRRNYYLPVNKTFLRIGACILALVAMALSVILPYEEDRRHQDRASVVPIEKIIDTALQKEKSTDNIPAEVSVKTESVKNPVDSVSAARMDMTELTEHRYYLIVGTFRTEREASSYIATHPRRGYTLVTVPSKTLCRVSAMSGNDREEMLRELNSERFKSAYGEGWIWTK